jgi:uncharacterized membrane protein
MLNLHPILVHFPIGLLTIYALLEFLRLKQLRNPSMFVLKAFLVIVGFASACATWLSGQLIEHDHGTLMHPELLGIHNKISLLTTLTFGLLAAAYLVQVLQKWKLPVIRGLIAPFDSLSRLITQRWPGPVLAAIGLILLTLTGALGGVIVYGPQLDPFTNIVYQLFRGFSSLN